MKLLALIGLFILCLLPLRAEEPRPLRVAFVHSIPATPSRYWAVEPLLEEKGRWVIERSTNLVDWALVYTNMVDLPALYRDTNSYAMAFYRADYTAPPRIVVGPTNVFVRNLQSPVLQSVEIAGPGPLTCEWRRPGGHVLLYGTNVSLPTAHGQYVMIVRGPGGTAGATFTVEIGE